MGEGKHLTRGFPSKKINEQEIDPVVIEDNVWIGTGTVILKGVTIGEGLVIAANSLVT